MHHIRRRLHDDITFHTFFPWFLAKLVLLVVLGLLCRGLAVAVHPIWWAGMCGTAVLAVVLSVHYATQGVVVRSTDLVFRDGLIWIYEARVPLEQVVVHIEQSALGRMFDYGTLHQRVGIRIITIRDVANIRMLQLFITERQRYRTRAAKITPSDGLSVGWE